MIEIRWHARAGQGAKTAAHLFALATLREGRSAQAFPEYGPSAEARPSARTPASTTGRSGATTP